MLEKLKSTLQNKLYCDNIDVNIKYEQNRKEIIK